MSEFTCAICNLTFKKINNKKWNDFKAAEELLKLYPECKNYYTAIVCSKCNKKFVKWFSSLTEEEKK